ARPRWRRSRRAGGGSSGPHYPARRRCRAHCELRGGEAMNEDTAARLGYAAIFVVVGFVFVWLIGYPPLPNDGLIKSLVWLVALILSGASLIISLIWALVYGVRAGVRAFRLWRRRS